LLFLILLVGVCDVQRPEDTGVELDQHHGDHPGSEQQSTSVPGFHGDGDRH